MTDDPLLTPVQAAKRIGVTAATVRRWMRDGAIDVEPVGPTRKKLRRSVVDRMAPRFTDEPHDMSETDTV